MAIGRGEKMGPDGLEARIEKLSTIQDADELQKAVTEAYHSFLRKEISKEQYDAVFEAAQERHCELTRDKLIRFLQIFEDVDSLEQVEQRAVAAFAKNELTVEGLGAVKKAVEERAREMSFISYSRSIHNVNDSLSGDDRDDALGILRESITEAFSHNRLNKRQKAALTYLIDGELPPQAPAAPPSDTPEST